ncbi:uncharacterized protein DUF4136 [Sinobacterium caligoides]|uniref:Uncharacterized protein DUF4136 n=1 Tax=Sinobacterium caligoides TaxID=933926 RepID=A0A3N2D511_9GAMM|nr:DUF4136 domain-containing protein [Sinobacterium caligoides]ROR94861.1 uncharacterized protein DUF4136 [Sinobacterium caligoides]
MHTLKLLFSTALILAVTACSSYSVNSDYTEDYDFSQVKSFKWHQQPTDQASLNYLGGDIFDHRIRDYVTKSLILKGLSNSNSNPDIFVSYGVLTEDRTDINTYNTYSGYAPNWRYGYYGNNYGIATGSTQTTVSNYKQGTLMIDFIDPKSNQLIWRGTADGRLDKDASPEERREALREVVDKILAQFPPKS